MLSFSLLRPVQLPITASVYLYPYLSIYNTWHAKISSSCYEVIHTTQRCFASLGVTSPYYDHDACFGERLFSALTSWTPTVGVTHLPWSVFIVQINLFFLKKKNLFFYLLIYRIVFFCTHTCVSVYTFNCPWLRQTTTLSSPFFSLFLTSITLKSFRTAILFHLASSSDHSVQSPDDRTRTKTKRNEAKFNSKQRP